MRRCVLCGAGEAVPAGRRSSETGLEELEAGGSRQWSSKESLGFSRRRGAGAGLSNVAA